MPLCAGLSNENRSISRQMCGLTDRHERRENQWRSDSTDRTARNATKTERTRKVRATVGTASTVVATIVSNVQLTAYVNNAHPEQRRKPLSRAPNKHLYRLLNRHSSKRRSKAMLLNKTQNRAISSHRANNHHRNAIALLNTSNQLSSISPLNQHLRTFDVHCQ